jgi:integrase
MSNRRIPGLTKKALRDGRFEWYIDKRVKGYGRLCESTGTSEIEDAEAILIKRVKECRDAVVHGIRPRRLFREAAAEYLTRHAERRGIGRDVTALQNLDSYIGSKFLDEIYDETFQPFRDERAKEGICVGTVDRDIGTAARVLEEAATKYRDEVTKLTWLRERPYINYARPYKKREPYPLDWDEQRLLFSELAEHLATMGEFIVNAGPRDEEVCALEWAWEIRVPELDTPELKRTVFIIPEEVTKCFTDDPHPRLLVLNDAAQRIVDAQRGLHPRYVFTYKDVRGGRDRLCYMLNSGWKAARKRAADRYRKEFGREAPMGFRRVRVHDLRHTFGRRLRAAGAGFEDRQDLLGHKSSRVTTHYSAPEIGNLVRAANLVTDSRRSPARTVLRIITASGA